MDFTEPKSMQSDVLHTTKFFCSSIYKTKLGKSILLMFLAIHGAFTIGFIYFSFNVEKDFRMFVSQAPLTLAELWPILVGALILIKPVLIENLPQEIKLWSAESAGEEIKQKIKKEAKTVNLFTIALYSAGLCSRLLYIKSSPNDSKYFFAFYFFDKYSYFPDHTFLFGFLYRCTFPLFAYISMTHAFQFIYYTQQVKYQLTMYHKHVECLAEYGTSEQNNLKIYYDNEYQKEISRRLNFIIRRHNEFKKLWHLKKEEMEYLIGIFSLATCLLGTGFAMWFIMFYEDIFLDYLMVVRGILLCTCTLITSCALILFGQILEDESIKQSHIMSGWYLFDNSNKKKLLIFIINANREIKIQFLNNSVNFELGLKIVKGIYAVASVVFKMKINN